jgi:PTS system N-acetylglucosamine-specific IIC component
VVSLLLNRIRGENKMHLFLQRIGRSLLIPIAVMPVAAILMRLGAPDLLNIPFMAAAGSAIFDNLALLFATGIAIGMSDDHRGEAVLAAVVGLLVLVSATQALLTTPPPLGAGYSADDDLVTGLGNSVAMGIIAGLIAVWTYNRFRRVKLPSVLAFFSGRRLVPILTSFFVLAAALILAFLWPPIWTGLEFFNGIILGWGAYGTAVFGLLNRALLPFGLHHVLDTYFWFSVGQYTTAGGEVVTGDIPRFLSGDPTAGPYQVGFYPIMMFGLIGAALAIIISARKSQRAKILGLLGGAALISLITGITEPLEYSFLFAAPLLYGVHVLLTGASMLVTNLMGLRHGFGFSAGLIDYLVNFYLAERPIDLLIVGGVFFVVYFLLFYILIRVFNLKTPGREAAPEIRAMDMEEIMLGISDADDELAALAKGYIYGLGGVDNIVAVDTCATSLRLLVQDSGRVDDGHLKVLGAREVVKPSPTAVQVVVGVEAEFIANAIRDVLRAGGGLPAGVSGTIQPRPTLLSRSRAAASKPSTYQDPAIAAAANLMIKALGGAGNIVDAHETAMTRIRVVVEDPQRVDQEALRAAGISGIMEMGNVFHLLLGMQARAYSEEMQVRLAQERAGQ